LLCLIRFGISQVILVFAMDSRQCWQGRAIDKQNVTDIKACYIQLIIKGNIMVRRNKRAQKIRRVQQAGFESLYVRRDPLLTWGCSPFLFTFSSDVTLPRE
jgi:hypothetical protein